MDKNNVTSLERLQNMLTAPSDGRPTDWANPLEKIEQLLTCSVCLDRYKTPKLLPCQHTFCLEPCLEGLADSFRRLIRCPECRAEHQLPFEGAKGFQTNYSLVGFLEIHLQATEENAKELEAYVKRYNLERCNVCDEKAEVSLCSHCGKKICQTCASTHVELLKRDLSRLTNQIKRLGNRIVDSLEILSRNLDNLKFSCSIARDEIREYGRYLAKELKKREDKLVAEIDSFESTENRLASNARQNLESDSSNLSESCQKVEAYLNGQCQMTIEEMTQYKTMFTESIERLRAVNVDADDVCNKKIIFSFGPEPHFILQAIGHFGELQVSTSQDSQKLSSLDRSLIPRLAQINADSLWETKLKKNQCRAAPSFLNENQQNCAKLGSYGKNLHASNHASRNRPTSPFRQTNKSPEYSTSPTKATYDFLYGDKLNKKLDEKRPKVESAGSSSSLDCRSGGAGTSNQYLLGSNEGSGQAGCSGRSRHLAPLARPRVFKVKSGGMLDDSGDSTKRWLVRQDTEDDELNQRIENIRRNFEQKRRESKELIDEFANKSHRLNKELKRKSVELSSLINTQNSDEDAFNNDNELTDSVSTSTISRSLISVPITVCEPKPESEQRQDSQSSVSIRVQDGATGHDNINVKDGERDESGPAKVTRGNRDSSDKDTRKFQRRKTDRNRHKTIEVLQSISDSADKKEDEAIAKSDKLNSHFGRHQSQPTVDYFEKGTPQLCFGSRGSGPGQLNWPVGVCYLPGTGDIAVCDSTNHRLQIFDSRSNWLKNIGGGYGTEQGEFDCLAGVAVNLYGQLVVSDKYNHRIQIFDYGGKFIREFGSHGQTNGKFDNPWGLVVDNQGFIYVCDRDNNRIQIFQADGSFAGKFGSAGSEDGQFHRPTFIALNRQNQLLYVSDTENDRVQVFDLDGVFQFSFGRQGFDEGHFKHPLGIALDDQGYIAVADSGNNRIQIFYPNGRFMTMFGTWGSNPGQMKIPDGVAIADGGRIIVADRDNHRIQAF